MSRKTLAKATSAYAPGPQGSDKPGCRGIALRSVALAVGVLAVVLTRTVV